MKDVMELAREVKSIEAAEIEKELFEIIRLDKSMLAEIVRGYCREIVEDVSFIKNVVHDYHNPVRLDDGASGETLNISEKNSESL